MPSAMAFSVRQSYTANDVASLIPKFWDSDSDIRFMSLVDLCNILSAGPQTLLVGDVHTAARVVDCLIVLLDDTNGDVQSQALKRSVFIDIMAFSYFETDSA